MWYFCCTSLKVYWINLFVSKVINLFIRGCQIWPFHLLDIFIENTRNGKSYFFYAPYKFRLDVAMWGTVAMFVFVFFLSSTCENGDIWAEGRSCSENDYKSEAKRPCVPTVLTLIFHVLYDPWLLHLLFEFSTNWWWLEFVMDVFAISCFLSSSVCVKKASYYFVWVKYQNWHGYREGGCLHKFRPSYAAP